MKIESAGTAPPQGAAGTDPPEGSNQQQAAGMTAEEFHRNWTAREKKLEAKFAKEQSERETALEQKFTERFSSLLDEKLATLKPKEDPKPGAKGKDEPAPALKLEDLPEWKAQQEKLAKLEREASRAASERDAEREKNRSSHLRTTAQEALSQIGVRPGALKGAMALLINAEGRIGFSDNGKGSQIVWRDENGDEVPLDRGLGVWAKTPEGKEYLPPLNPGGSGGGPGRGSGNGASTSTDDILSRAFGAHARGDIG